MAAGREEIVEFCDELLDAGSFDDYGPNGLQVPGAAEVSKLATGVSAHRELLERPRTRARSCCSSITAFSGISILGR